MFLAAGVNESVSLVSSNSFTVIKSFEGHGSSVTSLRISDDNRLLAVGTNMTGIWIWDLTGDMSSAPKHVDNRSDGAVRYEFLHFSADNNRLLAQQRGGFISNWDLPTMTKLFTVESKRYFHFVESFFCNGDQQFLSVSHFPDAKTPKMLTLWNAESGIIEKRFDEIGFISSVDLSPDGTAVALLRRERSVLVFDLKKEAERCEINATMTEEYRMCRFLDPSQLILTGRSGISVWEVTTQTQLSSYPWIAVSESLCVLRGTRLAAYDASFPAAVIVFNVDTGDTEWKLEEAHQVSASTAVTILL
jgi:WD40 repeat protein